MKADLNFLGLNQVETIRKSVLMPILVVGIDRIRKTMSWEMIEWREGKTEEEKNEDIAGN